MERTRPAALAAYSAVAVVAGAVVLAGALGGQGVRMWAIGVGIFFQAAPFLALGVLVSELIEEFAPPERLARLFPRGPASIAAALAAALVLPVCDCSAVPVFRSLVRKGVPTSAAVTLMLASPSINPIVVWSTWYAFGSWRIVVLRALLAVAVTVVVGVMMGRVGGPVLVEDEAECAAGCGCHPGGGGAGAPVGGRLALVASHSATGFGRILPYLLVGIALSSAAQVLISPTQSLDGAPAPVALGAMMAAGFVFSLCSSSDAIIARSLSALAPAGALLGFMVYGPMMDVKNVLLLSSSFDKRFVAKLFVVVTVTSAAAVGCVWALGLVAL
ncbi:permease [Schaalia georgiae]|uniref:permease n=1 Tax=Schaalia georgiae TaxID=52768 RepID=UPI0003FF56D1|nr:permease [Schaalia georgiae]